MGHVDLNRISFVLPDGRPLLDEVSFRVSDGAQQRILEVDDEPAQLAYAQALADWADVDGYDYETRCDTVTTAALGLPYDRAQHRFAATLSGGDQRPGRVVTRTSRSSASAGTRSTPSCAA